MDRNDNFAFFITLMLALALVVLVIFALSTALGILIPAIKIGIAAVLIAVVYRTLLTRVKTRH
jgi:hypothetical protein